VGQGRGSRHSCAPCRRRSSSGLTALDSRSARPPAARDVYLGGGTPSLLPADAVAEVLARIGERFGLAGDLRSHARGQSGARRTRRCRAWRDAGVTRLSIGASRSMTTSCGASAGAMDQRMSRRAVREARAAGLGSVSLDLLMTCWAQPTRAGQPRFGAALKLDPDTSRSTLTSTTRRRRADRSDRRPPADDRRPAAGEPGPGARTRIAPLPNTAMPPTSLRQAAAGYEIRTGRARATRVDTPRLLGAPPI